MPTTAPAPSQKPVKGPDPAKLPAKASPAAVSEIPVQALAGCTEGDCQAQLLADPRLEAGNRGQTVILLHQLQRTHGNAQVAQMLSGIRRSTPARSLVALQRDAGACPAPPKAPEPMAPEQDPKFKAVTSKVKKQGKELKKHPPAAKKAEEAQKAAQPPGDDVEAQAKAAHSEKMGAAKPGEFDKAAFIAAVNKAIADTAPKNLEEADQFATSGKAGEIKGQVMDKVGKGKDDSAKDVKEKAAEPPDPSKATPKQVVPMQDEKPGAKPGEPGAAKAMPDKAPAEQTNLDAGKCETEAKMAEANVSEDQLAKSNEPEFQDAVKAKQEGQEHSATAPAEVKAKEGEALSQAKQGAGAETKGALGAMFQAKTGAAGKVGSGKSAAKAKDEAERAKVSTTINGIYQAAKTEVDAILNGLDAKVADAFTKGEAEARKAFDVNLKNEMDRWKEQRYSGVGGAAQWVIDKFNSQSPEVTAIQERARALYLSRMNKTISDVADIVGRELTAAKNRIARGRDEIKKYVAGLGPSLRKYGAECAKDIASKFDELDSAVNEKQDALVSDLAQKYSEARDKIDADIKQMQEENKGLWDKAKDAVGGAIETILKLKDMLLGVLARAAGAIDKIIKDPIGFVGNLVNAVKSGVQQFAANIGEHLKSGLMGWLFGELGKAGIEMPKSFDIKGILGLVMSLLGLTWAAIRARIVKALGPKGESIIGKLEQMFEPFKILITEGPAGLWKYIQDKIGDLKEQIMGPIKDFVITKVITAGVTWLISMLNPASAFIKACKAIYDIVMFFVSRAAQIGEFVNSVLDSIHAIASGGAGAVAGLIERTLARILPLVISFLAALLGLGGIGDKIKKVIESVQKPVMKAVDAVIKPVLKLGKKLLAKLMGKFKKGDKKGKKDAPGAVREAAKRDLQANLKDGVPPEQVQGIARSIYSNYKPKGLKRIRVTPQSRRPGAFEIFVQAMADTKATEFTVAEPEFTLTIAAEDLALGRDDPTIASGRIVTARGPVDLGRVESKGRASSKHAERILIAPYRLEETWKALADKQGLKGEKTATLQLAVNRSPCPPCARVISSVIEKARKAGWQLSVHVQTVGVYSPRPKTEEGRAQYKKSGKSGDAVGVKGLEILREHGVTVSSVNLTKAVLEKLALGDANAPTKIERKLAKLAAKLLEIIAKAKGTIGG